MKYSFVVFNYNNNSKLDLNIKLNNKSAADFD